MAIRWTSRFRSLSVLLLLLLALTPCGSPAEAQPETGLAGKSILVLHSFESNVPVFELTDSGLGAALHAGGVAIRNQFFEYLDLARNPGPEHRRAMAELMRLRYGHRKIDMIITMFPDALRFLLDEGRAIFPDAPVLALYMPPRDPLPNAGRTVIYQIPKRDLVGTLEIALKLLPDTKRVYVVVGTYQTDRGAEDQARREFKKWEDRLEFRYLSDMALEDILTTLSSAPSSTLTLMLPFTTDATGRIFTLKEVCRRVSEAATGPLFGLYEFLLGQGIVGGSLIDYGRIGTSAGEMALGILKRESNSEHFPDFLDVPPRPIFDWWQLRRWNLNADALPEGSTVLNRELTVWDLRFYIAGALVFILAQSFLIAVLWINKRHRRSAEESLRQKTEELDRFFNVSLDLLCIANTRGHFLRLNPAWEKVLGYTRQELMAGQFFDFLHPDDLEHTVKAVSSLISQQEVIHFENRYRSRDGTYRWLEWTSTPAGDLIYAAARDLTERLKAEAEDQHLREQLAHVTRVAMMGELTTSLAHEISQPLTAILGNAGAAQRFLSQDAPDICEVRQILDDIIRDDRRASEVVRKVRALVKREVPCYEPVDLNEMIRQVIDLIRGDSLLHGLSIGTDLSPVLATIHGDGVQLQQVILNLILNGAAAMGNTPSTQRKIIVRTAMPDSRTVKVSVRDFGTGIDEHQIERLFEPFYTTKPQGLGMGLSISLTIVKAHGGTMEASNNRDGGATFAFSLPVPAGDGH